MERRTVNQIGKHGPRFGVFYGIAASAAWTT